jgi:ATP-dependent DNA ligase
MDLSIKPMLAKSVTKIPSSEVNQYLYEPKWDGFRAIIHREGDSTEIGSRGAKPLTRYFPELVEELSRQIPSGSVIDGEIVMPRVGLDGTGRLDFDALQQRIHPAASRIARLANETPASFVAFDLLALNNESLIKAPLRERRSHLEGLFAAVQPPLYITAATTNHAEAEHWFQQFEGAGLDGVMAKELDATYQCDVRAMLKIKHRREADCVVAGYRPHKSNVDAVGSLLLGLHDEQGRLHFVGSTSSFTMEVRREMTQLLNEFATENQHEWIDGGDDDVRRPGAISRWSSGRDSTFIALRPELVCEVLYDQLEGERFRHTTTFSRWRPDRTPESCTYAQLEIPAAYDLNSVMR